MEWSRSLGPNLAHIIHLCSHRPRALVAWHPAPPLKSAPDGAACHREVAVAQDSALISRSFVADRYPALGIERM